MNLETTLERTAPTRAQWDAWNAREPCLAGLTYRHVRSQLRTGCQRRKDELLAALVRLARTDPSAFSVLAACLLPGLRHRIARYAPSLDRQEALAVMVAALYEAATAYDVDEHPRFVAEKVLALPTRRLRRAVATQRGWSERTEHRADHAAPTSSLELTPGAPLAAAVDAGIMSERDARLIYSTRIAGHPLRDVARQLGLRYEAGKKRRQRAEARWAAWWAPGTTRSRRTEDGGLA